MSGPNPYLSEYFGTANVDTTFDDAAAVFVKTAAEQGIDVGNMSDEQVMYAIAKMAEEAEGVGMGDEIQQAADEMAQAIASTAKEEVADQAAGSAPAMPPKEGSEKVAADLEFFDFGGRVMAHAQWDELHKLAQAAAEEEMKAEEEKKKEEEKKEEEGGSEKSAGRSGGRAVGAIEGRVREILRALKSKGVRASHKATMAGRTGKALAKKYGPAAGVVAGGAGAGGAAGYMAGKSKKGADFHADVLARMEEKIAEVEGYDAYVDAVADATIAKLQG